MAKDSGLLSTILERLDADPKARPFEAYVLAAFEGEKALAQLLESATAPERPSLESAAAPEPRGAYLKSITVEGFRGVGPKRTLDLPPGPGLTLVVGRNGSGKSSFAEALELLLTGDTYRWRKKSAVWRDGWRNLHHATAGVEAEFHVEGEKGATLVATRWKGDADLDAGETFAQIHGQPRMDLAGLGWSEPLKTYRPFLSYSELGSMLAGTPSELFDAMAPILGLDDLTAAQEALAEERKPRERAQKDAADERADFIDRLRALDDDRARAAVAALGASDLDAMEAVVGQTGDGGEGGVPLLRQIASLPAPAAASAAETATQLRQAHARVQAAAGTIAKRSQDLADVLDRALHFHDAYGDGVCPVCGRSGALDAAWHQAQAREVKTLRDAARDASQAQDAAEQARRKARSLPAPTADALARAAEVGLDASAATSALDTWRASLATEDCETLAQQIETHARPLESAVAALRAAAAAELQRREDRWKPIAFEMIAWLPRARSAAKGAAAAKPLKKAEDWLKQAAAAIRNDRFAPIKGRSQEIWNRLRLQSSVSLDDIRLTGTATKRAVELKVNVDGTEGAALGVMSQGEQNALALSLFIPRATLPESPFRFVVIDDPVQSMDPARVGGLAEVLRESAKTRQVVVFTHDDRLPEAVRRLAIPATVIEVTRQGQSAVTLRPSRDPVARYIEDAVAVARTDGLPPQAARRVVPGLCRLAVEAACAEAVRRRRLGRGDPHSAVEDALKDLHGTQSWAALALFDRLDKASEVLPHLNKQNPVFADVLQALKKGAHEGWSGALLDGVRSAEKLAGWLRART
jgi:energy-coupling factor transporter ATP-binding protein EcfA2